MQYLTTSILYYILILYATYFLIIFNTLVLAFYMKILYNIFLFGNEGRQDWSLYTIGSPVTPHSGPRGATLL
jgi:hypothetical protein